MVCFGPREAVHGTTFESHERVIVDFLSTDVGESTRSRGLYELVSGYRGPVVARFDSGDAGGDFTSLGRGVLARDFGREVESPREAERTTLRLLHARNASPSHRGQGEGKLVRFTLVPPPRNSTQP